MKRIFLAAAAAAAITFPNAALAGEPYIGASAGVSLPGDSQNEGEFTQDVPATADFSSIPTGTDLAWDTDFEDGFAVSGQLGYAFDNGFRVELEGVYSRYEVAGHTRLGVGGTIIDDVDVAVLTRGTPDVANPTVGEVISNGQGRVKTYGLFANIAYDIDTGSALKPYAGVGVGYQVTDIKFSPSNVLVAREKDGSFAYQAFVGAAYELSDNSELFAQATYRATTDGADIELDLVPAMLEVESKQTIISAGVRFRFGG